MISDKWLVTLLATCVQIRQKLKRIPPITISEVNTRIHEGIVVALRTAATQYYAKSPCLFASRYTNSNTDTFPKLVTVWWWMLHSAFSIMKVVKRTFHVCEIVFRIFRFLLHLWQSFLIYGLFYILISYWVASQLYLSSLTKIPDNHYCFYCILDYSKIVMFMSNHCSLANIMVSVSC